MDLTWPIPPGQGTPPGRGCKASCDFDRECTKQPLYISVTLTILSNHARSREASCDFYMHAHDREAISRPTPHTGNRVRITYVCMHLKVYRMSSSMILPVSNITNTFMKLVCRPMGRLADSFILQPNLFDRYKIELTEMTACVPDETACIVIAHGWRSCL